MADRQPEAGLDEFEKAARLSFRDYPSSSLVMIAALSSGVGWMLYKWLGRKRAGQRPVPDDSKEAPDRPSDGEHPAVPSATVFGVAGSAPDRHYQHVGAATRNLQPVR